ncbi:MAG: UDP-N-acetylmuramate--L-alanine ligase [Myxococcales bacterium]|nr:UDP-N-acetylmuramate--L-alanine ligase [Myxococcales bacterium]
MKHRVRHMHFVGIAGVGMSGLAELMHSRGYEVSGSDLTGGRIVDHLKQLGIAVGVGHSAERVRDADVVIHSTAIDAQNAELVEARRRGIPVIRRAEMLAEAMRGMQGIAIAGTHGKTTTTALIAHLLVQAKLDPTALVGGRLQGHPGRTEGAIIGGGDWLVTEADESDGSFLELSPCISVVTNIDADHLDHYGKMEILEAAFLRFARNIPFWGLCVVCSDHPRVRSLSRQLSGRVLRYGTQEGAELRARDLVSDAMGMRFGVERGGSQLGEVELPLPGIHNVENALAALSVALEVGVPFAQAAAGLASFRGVARRFEDKGSVGGVRVIDDYGHHPIEVRATLRAARALHSGRIVTIFQPHRFSRTRDCMDEFSHAFADCDVLIVTDTYAAGESPIQGASASDLARDIQKAGHPDVRYMDRFADIIDALQASLKSGDLVLTLGAGDVTQLGPRLLERLRTGAST